MHAAQSNRQFFEFTSLLGATRASVRDEQHDELPAQAHVKLLPVIQHTRIGESEHPAKSS